MNTYHRLTRSLTFGAILAAACGGTKVPTRLTSLDGQEVEIAAAGAGGGPTVVFESGLGDGWTPWDEVASQVAEHARVFAYSRPGYGASEASPDPRDAAHIVSDLRALLLSEGFTPPYLLVGHSTGGTYMELFAKLYPGDVAGAVLVDPRPRDFLATCEAAELDQCGIPDAVLETQAPTVIAEYRAFALASEQIDAAGEFGSYPLRVLTATSHPVSPAWEDLWRSMLGLLAAESAYGEQVIVPFASHYIQLDRPDEVVKGILAVLARAGGD